MTPLITLTSDFGLLDGYVASMKGVILSICPEARLIDISHQVPAQDVVTGALLLESTVPYFPRHALHLAVVDPGVGTDRKALALSTPEAIFIGPDNGLFGLVWQAAQTRFKPEQLQAVAVTEEKYRLHPVSPTFHGRDIFAPAAAHLARGVSIDELGEPIGQILPAPIPEPRRQGNVIEGQVIAVDRFGNCTTNLTEKMLSDLGPRDQWTASAGDLDLGPVRLTYAEVSPGQPLALIGSGGRLELAIRNGNYQEATGSGRRSPVRISLLEK